MASKPLNKLSQPVLTRKETELLALLEGNPGRCFSRGFLLQAIWGYSESTRTRTVDVHVSRLRKKLRYRRDMEIHTVVRQGYVLQRIVPQVESRFSSSLGAGSARSMGVAAGGGMRAWN
jgi:DNA-binding winged helix-turn-helix (wHTH) protein